MWTVKSFVLDDGSDVVEVWHQEYASDRHAKLRAKLAARLLYLREREKPPHWVGPCFHFLSGAHGVGAITFEVKNVQHRPLGFFGPGSAEFTILCFATEKGGKYLPAGCVDLAIERMKVAKVNQTRVVVSRRF